MTDALDFMVANTMQQMDAGVDKVTEYHDWVQKEEQIAVDINTNGVEQHELDAKNDFLKMFDQREMDMRVCISLYSSVVNNPKCDPHLKEKANENLLFLRWKIKELRRLRADLIARTEGKTKTNEQIAVEKEREARVDLTAKALSMGMTYAALHRNMQDSKYEHGIFDNIVDLRPPSTNVTEARNRVESFKERKKRLYMLIRKQRGLPVEEVEDENENENWQPVHSLELERLQQMRGFEIKPYVQQRQYA